ncbi:sigma-70 family RNA polymerase sigma factor (plasmid) [Streptomyces sp. NEAU-sy36]|uniref:RNA polymerase sigma factor n=1 Tax=unclassified Streptomyces TaxID=2593676 RepID=UPI0015D5B1D2|nr:MULTISPECIES: sigma-70 family RNA polymerase sigma factor [unclassified Streptomyces]QLJ06711.1 sigma-70 family RNA polymerase sigma factor [Streptomyces sp. NEAU-sy36]
MTVQAEETTAPVDLAAAERQYEEAYRRWWKPLTYFIYSRLDQRHVSYAEDIAADTFVELWTKFAARGKDIQFPWGLLCHMGRQRIGDFYGRLASIRELAIDFSDPLNRDVEAGHSYATDQPEAAILAAELNDALEVMADLSKKWREAHTKTSMYRSRLEGGRFHMRPETRTATKQRVEQLTRESDQLLIDFRESCARVGELRRDLEAAGGPNWQSSTGMPSTAMRNWTKDKGTMSEPTRTHCDDGHELTLENTLFTPKGAKRCRTCMEASWRASRAAKPAMPKVPGPRKPRKPSEHAIPEEKIQQARELLKNPDLSIRQVAAMVGLNRSSMCERIPDLDQLRDVDRKRIVPVSDELLEKAVSLLTDPDHPRSVRSVCAELGFSNVTLYNRVPNLPALRAQAREKRRALAGAVR